MIQKISQLTQSGIGRIGDSGLFIGSVARIFIVIARKAVTHGISSSDSNADAAPPFAAPGALPPAIRRGPSDDSGRTTVRIVQLSYAGAFSACNVGFLNRRLGVQARGPYRLRYCGSFALKREADDAVRGGDCADATRHRPHIRSWAAQLSRCVIGTFDNSWKACVRSGRRNRWNWPLTPATAFYSKLPCHSAFQ
jgi:hypothetical protein